LAASYVAYSAAARRVWRRVKLGALLGVAATMINWTALWRAFMISCRTAMLWANGDEASSQPVFFVVGP
jgi:hypothetical protein